MRKFKILISVSFFVSIFCADAQTEKGRWLLGGSIGLYNSKSVKELDRLNLDFNVAYLLTQRLALGIRPIYIYEKSDDQAIYNVNGKTFGAGFFGRYYFLEKNITPVIDINIGYQHTINKWENIETYNFFYYTNYGIGINYFLNRRLVLEGIYRLNAEYFDFSFREMFTITNREARVGIQLLF